MCIRDSCQAEVDLGQRAHFFAHRPKDQQRCFALLLQTIEGARQAHEVSGQHRFAQTVEVVARDIEHRVANLFEAVSYTHLDVYKRQAMLSVGSLLRRPLASC